MLSGNTKGFTLVELMVAMAVMAFGILGFMFLNNRSLMNRTFYRDLNSSTQIAEIIAETLMHLDYDNPLLNDSDNSDATATGYPLASANDGDTETINGVQYTVKTEATVKWFTITPETQTYYIRWEITTGNSAVANSPIDRVKLINIFAAFEKKDPDTGNIVLGGYNPNKIGPTITTFIMDDL